MNDARPDIAALRAAYAATWPGGEAPGQNLWSAGTDVLRQDGKLGLGEIYTMWPVLHVMNELWEGGGIGADQRALMQRAPDPKAGILARIGQALGGVCFVALHGEIAVIHALHVEPDKRRKAVAAHLMKAAAVYAHEQGAAHIVAACAPDNAAANALFERIGMDLADQSA